MWVAARSAGPRVLSGGGEDLLIVPGHPTARVLFDGALIFDHRDHVVEGIGPVGDAGLDDAHEDVPNLGSAGGSIVQAVLPVQDLGFEQTLGNVMPTAGLCRVAVLNRSFPA